MIPCLAIVGGVSFVIVFIVASLTMDAPLSERLSSSLLIAGGFTLALLICALSDGRKRSAATRKVRQALLAREDQSDADFLQELNRDEEPVRLEIRRAIAAFFDVPPEKIHARDKLEADYQFQEFEPALHDAIIVQILPPEETEIGPYSFNTFESMDLGDFTDETMRAMEEARQAAARADRIEESSARP